MPVSQDVQAVAAALAAPFDPGEVRFRPVAVSGRRALALAYIDARSVQDRLDQVLGVTGWQDEYTFLEGDSVLCRLKILLGGQWVVKSDVGSPGEQSEGGNRRKSACSDALKRAAVKYGVARYLYRLAPQWVDYDPRTGQFVTPPRLPGSALPCGGATEVPRGLSLGGAARGASIDEEQHGHLLQLLSVKGYSPRKLAERYGVGDLRHLTPDQYRHAAGSLARLPDRMVSR